MNNDATIRQCIENIEKYIPFNQIIVVDGGSKDQTVEIAEKFGAKVHLEPGSLPRVRYVQATLCSSDWIAVVDSDVFVNTNWWHEVSKYLNKPEIAAVSGWLEGSMATDILPSYEQYTKFLARGQIK
jgi:glycosyltransferase involved in cell wall biosynthesis